MSTVVAIVKSIVGQVIATSAEGAHRVLVEGDRLYVGDTLDTGAGGMVTLELTDGRMLDLGRDTQWSSADAASAITETPAQTVADARAEVVDVQRAIVAGADPTKDLAPTAAGPGAGGAAGAAGGSHSFVLLSETAGEVQPDIGINFTNASDGDRVVQDQAFGDNPNLPPAFTDAAGNEASATINVTTDEDVAFNGAFSAVDGNGDALTYTVIGGGVAHGSLTLTPQGVWVYTPSANYNGPDSFQVVVSDTRGGTDTLTVNIGVTPVNDAPVADPAAASATEDGAIVSGQLTASDVDTGDTQTYTLQNPAPAGFNLNADGTWSLNPSDPAYQSLGAGQQLTISVPFTVTDSGGLTSTSVLTLTLTGVNDAPVVSSNVAVITNEDATGLTVDLLSTASDADNGDTISVSGVAQSGAGDASGVTINGDGTLSVNPNAYNYLAVGESITLTYTYNVVDLNGGSTPATATVTINGVNDAPVVSSAISATFSENAAPQTINLLQNASDVDLSDSVRVDNLQETSGGNTAGVTQNANGTLSVNPNAYNYLAAGQTLTLTYTYNVVDDHGGVTPTSTTLTITGQNDAPVAVADVKSGAEDTVITGNVLTNDSDPDAGAVLSVSKYSVSFGPLTFSANAGQELNTGVGKITIAANGDFTFTPVANYNGPVPTVTYTLTDGTATTTSTLNITVSPVNDAPVIVAPTTVQISEDGSKVFGPGQNPIGTSDIDSVNLTTTLNVAHGSLTVGPFAPGVTVTGSGTGTLVLSGNQAAITLALQGLTYKPVADYNGNDLLHITSSDGTVTTTKDVALTITPVADIAADNVSVNEDNSITFNPITGVGGGTADTFSNPGRAITALGSPQHGTVALNPDGTVTYTPTGNYFGTDTFTYTVTSGGVTETATVTVNVNPVNDAAVLAPADVHVNETDSAITTGGTLTITDIDSPATFTPQTNVAGAYGTFSINAAGVWTFVANSAFDALNVGQSVSDTFTVTSADGTATTVKVTIDGTNDAPVASSTVVAGGVEDQAAPIAVTLGGTDIDGTVVSYTIQSLPTNGTLYTDAAGTVPAVVGAAVSGSLYFVPTAHWDGSTTFTFTATDNSGAISAPATATINVSAMPDVPTVRIVTDTDNDGTLTNTELGASPSVTVKITVPAGTVVGDTLNITNPDGSVTAHPVVAADLTDGVTLTYPRPADGAGLTVSATVTNGAGNTSAPGSDTAIVGDTTAALAPVVTIVDDANNNAQLTAGEIGTDGVQVTVAVNNADLVAGGTVSLNITNGGVAHTANLALVNGELVNVGTNTPATGFSYNNGTISFTETKPATGASIGVTATQSDAAGNVSPQGSDSAVVVNTPPVAIGDHFTLGLTGQYFGYVQGGGQNLENIAQVESLIAGKTPDATFVATKLNYGSVGGDLGVDNHLQTFLGNDAATLSTDPGNTSDAIIKLSGQVSLEAGTYSFKVTSDDGFILRIDGQTVVSFDGNRSASATTASYTIATGGAHQIEIIYWDQGGDATLKVEVKGATDADYSVLGATGNTGSLVTAEDSALTLNASTLLKNDSDADGDTLTVTSVQNPTHGTVALNNGVITFTPAANYNGEATFQYSISDGHGGTSTATVTLYVTPVNDAPVVTSGAGAAQGAVVESGIDAAGAAVTGPATASGTLTATDVDAGSTTTWSVANGTGAYGSLSINAAGAWVYTLDNSKAATQALTATDTKHEFFTATVSDGLGGTTTQIIDVTVKGTNDAPIVTSSAANAAGSVTEAGAGTAGSATASGTLTASDVDTATTTWSVANGAGTYGSLTINPAGAWVYTLDNSKPATNALAAGESKPDTFTVTVSDGLGGTATQVITVTVNGTNDAPVVTSGPATATGTVVEAGNLDNGTVVAGTPSATGLLAAQDAEGSTAWSVANGTGTYGTLAITAAGVWTYTLNNTATATQALAEGQSGQETFTATVTDSNGATSNQVITVNVTGTNDAPTVSAPLTATGTEDGANVVVNLLSGASDVDAGSALSVTNVSALPAGVTLSGSTLTVNPADASFQSLAAGVTKDIVVTYNVTDEKGAVVAQTATITLTGTNDAPTVSGAVTASGVEDGATFTVNLLTNASDVDTGAVLHVASVSTLPAGVTLNGNTLTVNPADASFQSLSVGELKTLTVTYNVVDDKGALVAQTATITITGTNDLPVVTSGAAAATGTAVEAGNLDNGTAVTGSPTATGTLTATDVDHGSATHWTVASGTGTYGSLSITDAGVWTYTLNNSAAATNALAEGETGKETFTAIVTDDKGATVNQTITINVTGTNDSPVVTSNAAAATGTAVEAGNLDNGTVVTGTPTATGTLTASDVDHLSSTSWNVANGTGNYGTLAITAAGVWTYTLNNNAAATNALAEGQTGQETFTATVTDNNGATATQVITVNVTGTNDSPTISGTTAGTVVESGNLDNGTVFAGTPTAIGTLIGTDADQGATQTWGLTTGTVSNGTSTTAGTYGSLSLNSSGTWTYTLDNTKAATNALGEGQAAQETFTAKVTDNNGAVTTQVITVNVTGTNDAPAGTDKTVAMTEDVARSLTASDFGFTDVDTGDSLKAVRIDTLPGSGSLTLNGVAVTAGKVIAVADLGGLVYTPAANANGTALSNLTFSVQDSKDGFDPTPNKLTFDVAAVNDAPVALADHYTTGLNAQYFGYAQGSGLNLTNIAQVEALIAGKTPNATFTATNINYGGTGNSVSGDLGAGTNLQTFLGTDKATLSADPVTTTDAIIKLTGQVSLDAGTYTFKVTSDDGFVLRIDGVEVAKFDNNRGVGTTTGNYTIATSGYHQIEIIYWDQGGNAVLKVETKVSTAADSTYTVLGASGNTSSLTTAEDQALAIKTSLLLGNDSDVDGDTITVTSVQNATHGTVALANGVVTFTPDANYHGDATFQYTISDGKGGTSNATVTLLVTAVNDAPTVSAPVVLAAANEDTGVTITSAQLLGNATDVDGNTLTVKDLTVPASQGTLVSNPDGTWTFTPVKDFNGNVTFSYNVNDGAVSTPDTATLVIKPVADIVADTGVTNEDSAITLNVLGNDNFSNSNATITSINGTAIANNGSVTVDHGSVQLVNGQLVFTPATDYHGQSNFTYTVTSGGATETAGVQLMINAVSDAAAPTVTVTPKGYWTFDSATGGTVTNATTGQTGTLADNNATGDSAIPTVSTTSRADGAGSYLQLNSGTDIGDHVDVSPLVTAALLGTATLTFWVNTAQAGGNNGKGNSWNNPSIIGSEQAGATNDIQWGAINSSGQIGLGLGNANGVYSTTSINDSQWHNIAISRDASSGLVSVYVDGKLEATGSPTDSGFTGALNQLLEIGATNAFNGSGDVADTNYYKGALDDLRIYSGVLTADQIAAINHVEHGYQNTAVANAVTTNESTLSLSVTDTASALTVSGLENGMTLTDGTHTATSTGVDSLIDLSGWSVNNLTLGHTGTDSATLVFTGTNTAANGDTSTTYEALTLANGTSVLATGTTGNDTLTGSSAADLLRGGDGNDTLYGLAGNDRLEGGAGNDSLYGGDGNDLLIGGGGNDLLFGGSGNNILTGGSGADTFTWQAGDVGKSTITDFNTSEGDRINLNDLLPDVTDANILSYLKVDTATSTIQVSTTGHIDQGSNVSITLQGVDLTTYGSSSADIIKSLVAGTDPVVKVDHH